MPELGKATYQLIFNTRQYDGAMTDAETRTQKATRAIGQSIGAVEKELDTIGPRASEMAAQVNAAGSEAAAGFEKEAAGATAAAEKTAAASGSISRSAKRAGAASVAAGRTAESSWRKMGTSMAATGRSAFKMAGLAGLGIAYFVIKDGLQMLKENDAAWRQVTGAIQTTGNVAAVTSHGLQHLADKWEALAGVHKHVTYGLESLLLRFTLIRNEAGKGNAVFYRTVNILENVALGMKAAGRVIKPQQLAVMLGRALTDPAKGLNAMGRAGIKFSQGQQKVVKALIAAHKPLQAQTYILGVLEKAWGKAGVQYGQSIPGKIDKLKAKFSQFSADLLKAFLGSFTKLLGFLDRLLKWMEHHTGFLKVLIIGFVALKAAIIGVGIAVSIFEALTSPALLVVGAILALVAAFVMAVKFPKMLEAGLRRIGLSAAQAHNVVRALQRAFAWIKAEAIKLWPAVRDVFVNIKNLVVAVVGFIRKHWQTFVYYIRAVWHFFVNTLRNDLAFLKALFQFFIDLIHGRWGKLWGDIKAMAQAAWNQIKNIFWFGVKLLLPVFQGIVNAFIWAMNKLISVAAKTAEYIVNAFIAAWNLVADHSFGALNHIDAVTFNWGLGYVNLMGSIGASAGGALGSAFYNAAQPGIRAVMASAANAAQSSATSGYQGSLKSGTYKYAGNGHWTKGGKPVSASTNIELNKYYQQQTGYHGLPGKPGATVTIAGRPKKVKQPNIAAPTAPPYSPLPPSAFDSGGGTKKKKKGKKGKKPSAHDQLFGAGFTALEIALTKAERAHNLRQEAHVLEEERNYLKKRIALGKFHGDKLLALQKALTSISNKILSIRETIRKNAERAKLEALQIELYKAQLAGNDTKSAVIQKKMDRIQAAILATEEKLIRKEIAATEQALKKHIITKQQALDREAALYKKLLDLDKQRLALLKKSNAMKMANAKEMLQLLELRGSFFSQFAGNIFGGSEGNLSLTPDTGGNTKTVNVNQHNTYAEIPKNRHHQADQMRRATAAAMAGP